MNATRLLTTSRLRPTAAPTRATMLGTVQIVGSAMLLVGIVCMYLVRPGVSAGAPSTSVVDPDAGFDSSWTALLSRAQVIRMSALAPSSDLSTESEVGAWAGPIDQLSTDIEVLVAAGSENGADERLRRLSDLGASLSAFETWSDDEIASVLDGLIVELDVLAAQENVVMIERLESASRAAVVALGRNALVIAGTAVLAAVGLLGLGAGVQRLLGEDARRRAAAA